MLADGLESIISAVYLDRGFDEVRRFIVEKLLPIMVRESLVHDTNYKSFLLETVQGKGLPAPRYVVVREQGPDHEKHFTVDVVVEEQDVTKRMLSRQPQRRGWHFWPNVQSQRDHQADRTNNRLKSRRDW